MNMKLPDIKRVAVSFIEKNLRIPLILVGHMGLGKSMMWQAVAKEQGYTLFDFRGATQEATDLTGMPHVKDLRTMWAVMDWLPQDPETKLMLVIDELNRAPLDVRQAVFQLLTEYKIHTHLFPKHTFIVVCMNPDDSFYQVEEIDTATYNRGLRIDVDVDHPSWLAWASESGVHTDIVQFINSYPDMLMQPEKSGTCPTPRSWHNVSKLYEVVPEDLRLKCISGLVGNTAAVAFMKFVANEMARAVEGEDILRNYEKVQAKCNAQKNDMTHATIRSVERVIKEKMNLTKAEWKNVEAWLTDLKQEYRTVALKGIPQKLYPNIGGIVNLVADGAMDIKSLKTTGQLRQK